MHDDATAAVPQETGALIDHVLTNYHEMHRADLASLVPLAERVEQVHAESISPIRKLIGDLTPPERGLRHGCVLSGYWPIKGEPDLPPVLADLHCAGITIALPAVETRAAPLVFRRWAPKTRLVRGGWNIPVPPPDADVLVPDIALAPCLGWTDDCYRLSWGGGYFDRTLVALTPRPVTIGIALSAARLPTIVPHPHDIPLDLILTEDGIAATRPESRTHR